jgi:transcriptional regulator with XRE-family HTH domain
MQDKITEKLLEKLNQDISITKFLKEHQDAFIQTDLGACLNAIIREKNFTKEQVIKGSGINRRYFFDILSGKRFPDRNYILRILLAVQLPLEDAQWLLKVTKYSQLYARDRRDSVIIYSFDKKLDVQACNRMLENLSMELI